MTAKFIYTATATGTVQFDICGRAFQDDDVLDADITDGGSGWTGGGTDTVTAANDEMISATTTLTITDASTNPSELVFRVRRDVSADNMGADARLLHVHLEYQPLGYA